MHASVDTLRMARIKKKNMKILNVTVMPENLVLQNSFLFYMFKSVGRKYKYKGMRLCFTVCHNGFLTDYYDVRFGNSKFRSRFLAIFYDESTYYMFAVKVNEK